MSHTQTRHLEKRREEKREGKREAKRKKRKEEKREESREEKRKEKRRFGVVWESLGELLGRYWPPLVGVLAASWGVLGGS